jgi:hypothetical protein
LKYISSKLPGKKDFGADGSSRALNVAPGIEQDGGSTTPAVMPRQLRSNKYHDFHDPGRRILAARENVRFALNLADLTFANSWNFGF